MIELTLTKRKPRHAGEVGFFIDQPMFEDEFRLVSIGTEVVAKISTPKNIEALKYIWALATIVAEAVDGIDDKDDAMELLCVKARHMRMLLDPQTGKMEVVRKSLSRISNENLRRLIERMKYVVVTDILPGLKPGDLNKKLEEMVVK